MAIPAAAYAAISAAVSATAKFAQGTKQYNAQVESDEKFAAAQLEATTDTYKEITKSEQASAYNAGQDNLQLQIDSLNAKAQATTAASATGQSGQSVQQSVAAINQQTRQSQQGVNRKQQDELNATNAQAKQAQRTGTTQSTAVRPSAAGAVLHGVGTGLATYGAVK